MISGYIPGTDRQVGLYDLQVAFSIAACIYLLFVLVIERRALRQLVITDIFNKTI
jgi:hypothetical protein